MLCKGRAEFGPEIAISTLYLSISLGNKESTVQHLLSDHWLREGKLNLISMARGYIRWRRMCHSAFLAVNKRNEIMGYLTREGWQRRLAWPVPEHGQPPPYWLGDDTSVAASITGHQASTAATAIAIQHQPGFFEPRCQLPIYYKAFSHHYSCQTVFRGKQTNKNTY